MKTRYGIGLCVGVAVLATGCIVVEAPPRGQRVYAPPPSQMPPPSAPPPVVDAPVVGVDIEPPMAPPEPIAVPWSPPPMLVEVPPPQPYPGAVWIGGYWVWDGDWVWAYGRWVPPPRPDYVWVHPYYEHRAGMVVFVNGHWGPPGYVFVPPPPSMRITVVVARRGVVPGPRPMGPEGVFVPPPPGSRRGLIVPAPLGTAPAVVTSAPPIVNGGMRVQGGGGGPYAGHGGRGGPPPHVSIVAPATATANGQPYATQVPGHAHSAAGVPAVVPGQAPPRRVNRPVNERAQPGSPPNRQGAPEHRGDGQGEHARDGRKPREPTPPAPTTPKPNDN